MTGAPPAPPRSRGGPAVLVRLAIGAAVLGFIVFRRPAELGRALGDADLRWVFAAAAAWIAGIGISALRWRAYLVALELPLGRAALFRLYFVGTFFNAFLPTGVGGDAYKALRVGRARDAGAEAFASVFLDRFAGVVALAVIGFAGILSELVAGDPDLRVAVASLLLSGGVIVAATILLLGGERLLGRGRIIKREGLGEKIRRAMRAIHAAGRHPDAAARGAFYGLLFQALVLVMHLLVARALPGVRGVPIGAMAGIVVISTFATLIPLTINGLGFREAAYVWALGTFAVPRAEARAFAVLVLAILLATSALGGLVYVLRGGEVDARRRITPRRR